MNLEIKRMHFIILEDHKYKNILYNLHSFTILNFKGGKTSFFDEKSKFIY